MLATGNDQTVVYTIHGAQTPISNDDHANALGCSNSGLENCVCVSKQKKPVEVAQTISARMGTGGNNLPLVMDGVMYTQTVKDVHAVAYDECVPLDL